MNNVVVDIIIPIYNAYEDLKLCLDSIYKHTNLKKNRLILINDNSTDQNIRDFLDAQKNENIIVIHNPTNRGFSNNINTGMSQSEENDVLLLNSDTVVTANWLTKIQACAYSSKEIGTVTPLSNNATICSVPNFCEENSLPKGLTLDETAEIVERISLKKYPEITVAHGFCMYVKREVINAIGMFDAQTFGKGYGEENDFCNRAGQIGYKHVMCDDTYILHTGTRSFSDEEKKACIKEHDKILRLRYPGQMHANDIFTSRNPSPEISEHLKPFFAMGSKRKNILYVLQADFKMGADDNVGGTQLHVKHLTKVMRKTWNVFVAARDKEYLNLTLYTPDEEFGWRFYIGEKPAYYCFNDRKINRIFREIISGFKIEVVHIHHLGTLSFDVVEIAKELGLTLLFSLHDYTMIGPSEKLLDENYRIINRDQETPSTWTGYLSKEKGIYKGVNYTDVWRKKCAEVLGLCDVLIVPNSSVRDVYESFYPELVDKISVIEHGYEFEANDIEDILCTDQVKWCVEELIPYGDTYKLSGWVYLDNTNGNRVKDIYIQLLEAECFKLFLPVAKDKRLDIKAQLGREVEGFETLIPSKYISDSLGYRIICRTEAGNFGSKDIKKVGVNAIKPEKKKLNVAFIGALTVEKGAKAIYELVRDHDSSVNWFLFGNIGYYKLRLVNKKNFHWFGIYNSNDLPMLMRAYDIDLICVLSIWNETYSYTLSEALLCNVPVWVSDLGALGQRVRAAAKECCIPVDNLVPALSDCIDSLARDPDKLTSVKAKQSLIKVRSLNEMCNDYCELYSKIVKQGHYENADYRFLSDGNGTVSICNEGQGDAVKNEEYELITGSVAYRLFRKLANHNFVGKNMIRRVLKKIVRYE